VGGGSDTTSDAPVAISEKLRKKLLKVNAAKDIAAGSPRWPQIRPATSAWTSRRTASRAPGLSMGEHAALTAVEWQIGREEQDELAAASHQHLAAAYDAGFEDDLVTPFRGLDKDNNLRPTRPPRSSRSSSRSSARASRPR
jgi:acetyl-CoA C-acetyltransferase